MAHRAIVPSYQTIQPQGSTGVFQLTAPVYYIDDTNTHPQIGNINVDFTFTMTGAQINAAIIAEVIALGALMGFTVAASNNQIVLPVVQKV